MTFDSLIVMMALYCIDILCPLIHNSMQVHTYRYDARIPALTLAVGRKWHINHMTVHIYHQIRKVNESEVIPLRRDIGTLNTFHIYYDRVVCLSWSYQLLSKLHIHHIVQVESVGWEIHVLNNYVAVLGSTHTVWKFNLMTQQDTHTYSVLVHQLSVSQVLLWEQ